MLLYDVTNNKDEISLNYKMLCVKRVCEILEVSLAGLYRNFLKCKEANTKDKMNPFLVRCKSSSVNGRAS